MENEIINGDLHYRKRLENEEEEILLEPFLHVHQAPEENNIRDIFEAYNYWLNISNTQMKAIEDIVVMIADAINIAEDIQYGASNRKNVSAAHHTYGVSNTLNAVVYATTLALKKCLDLNHTEVSRIYGVQLAEIYKGQGIALRWRESYACPTEKEYIEMVKKMSGSMYMLGIKLMQLFSTNKEKDYTQLTNLIALLIYIREDYLNSYPKDCKESNFLDEISQGKFIFPIVHAINHYPDDQQMISVMRQRSQDNEVKKYCTTLLQKYGSYEYTKQKLKETQIRILKEIEELGGNSCLEALISRLCDNVR